MLLTFAIGCFYFSLFGMAAVLLYRSLLMSRSGRKRRLPADVQAALIQPDEPKGADAEHAPSASLRSAGENDAPLDPATDVSPSAPEDFSEARFPAAAEADPLSPSTPAADRTDAEDQKDEDAVPPTGNDHEEATPQKIIPLLRRVEILIARKEYDEAKKILIRILSWQNDHPDASAHLAYLYLQTGQYGKAETLFRKVLETRLSDPSLLTNFALAVLEQKDPDKITDAVEALRMAVKLEPKNSERYSNLGQASYLAGDLEGAVGAFENAVKLAPRNIEYLFFLADSYLAVQNYSFAKRIFSRILEISPLNAEAKQELDALQHIEG